MNNGNKSSALVGIVVASMLAGCMAEGDDEVVVTDTQEAGLACRDAACDGLFPTMTSCQFDGTLQSSADIFAAGSKIGAIGLFYSPSCHTVWAATAFYAPRQVHTCAVRRAATNDAICSDAVGTTSAVSPMRYLAVGRVGFGRMSLLDDASVTARTADFTRTF